MLGWRRSAGETLEMEEVVVVGEVALVATFEGFAVGGLAGRLPLQHSQITGSMALEESSSATVVWQQQVPSGPQATVVLGLALSSENDDA